MISKDIKEKWLRELRGSYFTQIKKSLRDNSNGRCALGVLAEVSGYEWKVNIVSNWYCIAPYLYGLDLKDYQTIIRMNESDKTFFEIADYIEKHVDVEEL